MTERLLERATRRCRWLPLLCGLLLSVGAEAWGQGGEVPKGFQTVGFNVLSGFDWEMPDPLDPGAETAPNVIPPSVKALHGKSVYLKGFMLPLDLDASGVSRFMLNASLDMCYFGAPVRLNDWVMVSMQGGRKAKFTHLPTAVWGVLEVGEEVRNGRTVSLYRLAAVDAKSAS